MKPNPGIFELVCNRFAENASDKSDLENRMKYCGHVGDSESQDYWGARSAGFGRAFLFKPNIEDYTSRPHNNLQSEFFDNLVPTEDVVSELGQILDR